MWIEVIYALPETQTIRRVNYFPGITAKIVLEQSGLLQEHPEWELEKLSLGLFSEKIHLQTMLNPGDRLEIYRPLTADPKLKRQERVKPMGKWHNVRR